MLSQRSGFVKTLDKEPAGAQRVEASRTENGNDATSAEFDPQAAARELAAAA